MRKVHLNQWRWLVSAIALVLIAVPAQAQDAPAQEIPPLTMEEAERVVYGYADALYAGDAELAATYYADPFDYYSRTDGREFAHVMDRVELRSGLASYVNGYGCRPEMVIIDPPAGNVVKVIGANLCTPPTGYGINADLFTAEFTIEEGKIRVYSEWFAPTALAHSERTNVRFDHLTTLMAHLKSGEVEEIDPLLADDVTLSVGYDPVKGMRLVAEGKAEVLQAMTAWVDAGVVYSSRLWGARGHELLLDGRLSWPSWDEAMGVPLYTEDIVRFTDDLIQSIEIKPRPEMARSFKARTQQAP